eukprot:c21167_g1_i1 orf=145-471(-)
MHFLRTVPKISLQKQSLELTAHQPKVQRKRHTKTCWRFQQPSLIKHLFLKRAHLEDESKLSIKVYKSNGIPHLEHPRSQPQQSRVRVQTNLNFQKPLHFLSKVLVWKL